jgi:hypothetical protein
MDMTTSLAIVDERPRLYAVLARHCQLLTAGHQAELTEGYQDRHVAGTAAEFLAALKQAATPGAPLPAGADDRVAPEIRAASEALAIAADILATHLAPRRRPATQEGAMMRAGAGVAAGLADIADITTHAIALDRVIMQRAARAATHRRSAADPLHVAASAVIDGPLPRLVGAVRMAATGRPRLLRSLEAAPATGHPAPAVSSIQDAVAALHATRTWMWQNLAHVRTTHVQAATQIGLATTLLAGEGLARPPVATHSWRRAAIAAAQLRGTTPTGDAANVHDALVDLLHWTRDQVRQKRPAPAGLDLLVAQLPALADLLHQATGVASTRGELFVPVTELRRRPGGPIAYAVRMWHAGRLDHDLVRDLRRALHDATEGGVAAAGPASVSPARRAFPAAPQPRVPMRATPHDHGSRPTGVARSRGR